jgi:hypothetical protein
MSARESYISKQANFIVKAPKVQEIKGIGSHFKKHWPGYAAAGAAGVIGTSYLKGKNDKQTSIPA